MNKTFSQAHQDIFALSVCTNKTYIEIGGNRPKKWNNSFLLEQNGFKGFSIERNTKWQEQWNTSDRINPIYWDDALTFDYVSALKENNLTTNVGYLSCDIEPAKNTFDALKKVIESGITFECITFEDDRYAESIEYDKLAIDFLKDHGYKLAVKDVYTSNNELFETWFINEQLVFPQIDYKIWLKKLR